MMSEIIANKISLFPHLSSNWKKRESLFINIYDESYHSGSHNPPPNRSQFEFIWANFILNDKEIKISTEDIDLDNLFASLNNINLKNYCDYPEDQSLTDKVQYCIALMGYNLAVQFYNETQDENSDGIYKKLDFFIPYRNHHITDEDSRNANFHNPDWRDGNTFVVTIGCYIWTKLCRSIHEDNWSEFWNIMARIFMSTKQRLRPSDYQQIFGKRSLMEVPQTKTKYIRDEYKNRNETESVLSKEQLVKMIESANLSPRILYDIQKVIESCHA